MGVTLKTRHVVVPAKPTWQGILPLSEFDQVGVISHTSVLYFYDRPGHSDFVESSKSMFRDLVSHIDYINLPIEDLPLLSVQVTRFTCDGVCVSIHFSHVIVHGISLFHFIKEWARLARGQPLELEPYFDRLALKHRNNIGEDPKVDDVDVRLPFLEMADADAPAGDEPEEEPIEPSLPTLIVMTADQIEHLKKLANQEITACHPYSRFEVITSHVWRCMMIARELEEDQITSFYVIVDGRSRMEPPLPPGYFGNAIIPVKASSKVKDLISKPLSYGCSKIREAVKQLSNEYMTETIEYFKKEESLKNHQFMEDKGDMVGKAPRSTDMWVISSLSLLAQNLIFGWGNEIYAGPIMGLGDGRYFSILPHYHPNQSCLKLAIASRHQDKFLKFFNEGWE